VIAPRKLLLVTLLCFAAAGVAAASTPVQSVYVTQNGSGSQDGTSLANAFPISALSDSSHCGSGSTQIGPGATVYLSAGTGGPATATFSVNSSMFNLPSACSGANGNPVVIQMQDGDVWQAPYFAGAGAIVIDNASYVVIDGGSGGTAGTGAVIQNSLNGTAGGTCPAGPCQYSQSASQGISAHPCTGCEIRNIVVANIYVRTSLSDMSGDTSDRGVFWGGSVDIHDSTFHDADWMLVQNASLNNTVSHIYNNNIYNMDHGIACGGKAGDTTSADFLYNNHIHDSGTWDGGSKYHHDGIHCFSGAGSNDFLQAVYIYNNLFDGQAAQSQCCLTAWVYLETGQNRWTATGTAYVWNNVAIYNPIFASGNGVLDISGGTNSVIVNNTMIQSGGPTQNGQNGVCLNASGTGLVIENNVMQGCEQPVLIRGDLVPSSIVRWDYNIYSDYYMNGHAGGNSPFNFVTKGGASTLSAWQTLCSCDANAVDSPNAVANLSNEGAPLSNFIGIKQGDNFMNIASGKMATLAYDTGAGDSHTPLARPGGSCSSQGNAACWEVGAYQYASGGQPPQPPTGLTAVVH